METTIMGYIRFRAWGSGWGSGLYKGLRSRRSGWDLGFRSLDP